MDCPIPHGDPVYLETDHRVDFAAEGGIDRAGLEAQHPEEGGEGVDEVESRALLTDDGPQAHIGKVNAFGLQETP